MSVSLLTRLRFFGAAGILAMAASATVAQTGPESPAATPPAAAAPKASDKSEKPAKPKPAAPSGFASEAEAKAYCKGSVVWVDKDHFNHYPGSREYGKKPGAFVCEKG